MHGEEQDRGQVTGLGLQEKAKPTATPLKRRGTEDAEDSRRKMKKR
jgi:hypothetical protein